MLESHASACLLLEIPAPSPRTPRIPLAPFTVPLLGLVWLVALATTLTLWSMQPSLIPSERSASHDVRSDRAPAVALE